MARTVSHWPLWPLSTAGLIGILQTPSLLEEDPQSAWARPDRRGAPGVKALDVSQASSHPTSPFSTSTMARLAPPGCLPKRVKPLSWALLRIPSTMLQQCGCQLVKLMAGSHEITEDDPLGHLSRPARQASHSEENCHHTFKAVDIFRGGDSIPAFILRCKKIALRMGVWL